MDFGVGRILETARGGLYRLRYSSSVDLAVTGLSKAGKTVFVTSLIQNLLRAGSADNRGAGSLEAFLPVTNGALRGVMLPPADRRNSPHFPFEECLAALASDTPTWPARTGSVSEIKIRLRFGNARTAGMVSDKAYANLTLRVVDYPGEWLLDLPLLDQSFEQWSAATIALSRERSRATLSERWFAFISARDLTEANDDAFCRQAAELYRDYLVECRDHGLRFLQPGQFLRLPGQFEEKAVPILDRPQLWFCPLPAAPGGNWKPGSIGAAMTDSYNRYCSETVGAFLRDTFGRFGRQLVLVDVLGALAAGGEAFDDTCRALSEVCRYLHRNGESLWERVRRLGGNSRMDKIAFAATKADHVPRLLRASLKHLLEQMLWDDASAVKWQGVELKTTYLSSVCSTEEEPVERDGKIQDAIVGRLIDTGKRVKVIIDQIPGEVPDRAYWQQHEGQGGRVFDFPAFAPPPINPNSPAGIRQIGMDRLLNFLIGDRFE